MNRFAMIAVAAMGVSGMFSVGCSHEVSHTESDKPSLLGGHTHEESTTYQNPDGSVSTDKSKEHVSN